jgi:hypothetical protein
MNHGRAVPVEVNYRAAAPFVNDEIATRARLLKNATTDQEDASN